MVEKIGLIADSHSRNALLLDAAKKLKELGADTIIHLGDICDSLKPDAVDEAIEILRAYNVKALMGNNELSIISENAYRSHNSINPDSIAYLKKLPYTLQMGNICFAHSAPFNWPAATRRPIMEYLPHLLGKESFPFKVLFRGHSHVPSLIKISDNKLEQRPIKVGEKLALLNNITYVITVGAVEDRSCALFLPHEYTIEFLGFGRI